MHPLAHSTVTHILRAELVKAGDRSGVAVSGGADSVGLLRLLLELRDELGIVVSVVHFNHKLRGAESDDDERFVSKLAQEFDLELHVSSGDAAAEASASGVSLETAARNLRYAFFGELLSEQFGRPPTLDKIATGHTLDDQAETVMMRIVRGTGMRGLGGIYPVYELEQDDEFVGEVIRPLLGARHDELRRYLKDIGQEWREDSSNSNPRFMRNRFRHLLMPMLEREFNPSVAEGLSELAAIARGEEDYWQNEIAGWMGTAIHWSEPDWAKPGPQGLVQLQPFDPHGQERRGESGSLVMNATVDRMWLLSEPPAVQRRAIKAVGDLAGVPLEFKHVEEVLRFAGDDENAGKRLSLPLGWSVELEPAALMFRTPDLRKQDRTPTDYQYPLPVPGRAIVPEADVVIEAVRVVLGAEDASPDLDQLFDPSLLPGDLHVRNWRPGDRFWPAHTKSVKKIKELLQERHITGSSRKVWPVLAAGEEIVWLRGFPIPEALRAKNPGGAILIRDRSLSEE